MVLVTLIFLITFGCFLTSVMSLIIILKHYYFSNEKYRKSNPDEAIIITGCDSGIGLELTKYFHKTSYYTIISCVLDYGESQGYKELKRLTESSNNSRIIIVKLDVTFKDDVQALVEKIEKSIEERTFSKVVALINNAGTLTYGELDWQTWNQIQTQIDVNLVGPLRLIKSVLPHFRKSGGRIVNVSSVNDTTVFPGLSIYSATKSGLSTFSKGLGFELRKFGVKVVLVRLGDFAKLTNIMSKHCSNKDDMWNAMDAEKKDLYKDYFHHFNNHILKNYGMTSPKKYTDSSLFRDFRTALMSENPPHVITCAPMYFRLIYLVLELAPIWLQYYLLELLLKLGFKWDPPS